MSDKRIHAATLLTEFRKSSTKAGNTLVDLLFETDPDLINGGVSTDYVEAVEVGDTPRSHPVILGVVTQPAGIDRQTTCLIGAYLFVTELLGGSAARSVWTYRDPGPTDTATIGHQTCIGCICGRRTCRTRPIRTAR